MRSDLRVKLPDGTMIGYAEAGDPAGPPVMYLHGSPSSRLEVGLPSIREAAEDLGLRVLAPDRPGMGLSTFCRYSIADYPGLVRVLGTYGAGFHVWNADRVTLRREPEAAYDTAALM